MHPRRSGPAQGRLAVAVALAASGAILLSGCAKMDADLDQQWVTVDFSETTSVATALHVRSACSHIANAPPEALPAKPTVADIMYGIRFNTTNASPANLAELQSCLEKFPSVQGIDPEDAGDEGG